MQYIARSHIFLLCFFTFTMGCLAQTCQQPEGKWSNEGGSLLIIDSVAPSGHLSGSYLSHEGTEGQQFTLTGWWQFGKADSSGASVLSFSVLWKPYQTITSWTGYCKNDKDQIETLWQHIDPEATYDFQKWSTQSSVFKPLFP